MFNSYRWGSKFKYKTNDKEHMGAVVAVIVWQLNLQLPVQSVSITTKCCAFESCLWWGVLDTTLCDKVCQWLVTDRWFSPGTPIYSANKTDRHDITEIMLIVVLNTITLTLIYYFWDLHFQYVSQDIFTLPVITGVINYKHLF